MTRILRSKWSWICLLAVTAVAFGWGLYSWGRPDPLEPDAQFELQFGRGSARHGLDVLRVTSDGNAVYEYQPDLNVWERRRFRLGVQALADLRKAIDDLDPWSMPAVYRANIADGTQWILLIRVEGREKAVYFDNNFPDAIQRLADHIDHRIIAPLADPVPPESVPSWHQRKHEKELWEAVRH
jgi:hypothetical protein